MGNMHGMCFMAGSCSDQVSGEWFVGMGSPLSARQYQGRVTAGNRSGSKSVKEISPSSLAVSSICRSSVESMAPTVRTTPETSNLIWAVA